MKMKVEPITLDGQNVRLEPLSMAHLDELCAVGLDDELWLWTLSQVHSETEMREYIENALDGQKKGSLLPFTTIEKTTGRVVGSTRYANIDLNSRRLEIGWTWIARAWQRTAVNTEAKFLMLRHAFETLGCNRVEFKTDALNERSRNAILRIGAKQEGILRKLIVLPGGRVRDTVYFSIIDTEWAEVKKNLEARLFYSKHTNNTLDSS